MSTYRHATLFRFLRAAPPSLRIVEKSLLDEEVVSSALTPTLFGKLGVHCCGGRQADRLHGFW